MKKIFVAGVLFAYVAAALLFGCKRQGAAPAKIVAQTITAQTDSFSFFITHVFLPAVKTQTADGGKIRSLFLQARLAYKKFEWAAEYFTPASAKRINGAPVPGVEYGQVSLPQGLQVMEGVLYPDYDTTKRFQLISQLEMLPAACAEMQTYFNNIPVQDWQVFDAAKLEVFRMEALGITGFDAPLAQNSMNEAATSLASLLSIMALYDKQGYLCQPFNNATAYLRNHVDFNTFNRAYFITGYANPLTASITCLQNVLQLPAMRYSRLLRQSAATLFDTNAFNATAYAPGTAYSQTEGQIALGKKLFYDPILSGPQTRSCASCHNPANAFTDGLAKNKNICGKGLLARNTPTLLNAALQPAMFYDMRVNTLEEQVMDVLQNKHEMNSNLQEITDRLWHDKTYRQLFSDGFAVENRTAIDTAEIAHAIAEYVRTLNNLNSRFDRYMRGDGLAMSANEVDGFNLFMGKAKCGTCHYLPLFNGTLPPNYMNSEPEVIGVPAALNQKTVDGDLGRFAVVGAAFYRHAFKTPTVRNAAKTAPYMHNGVFNTLQQVVDFYNKGGGAGQGLAVPNQTLPADKLHLNNIEIQHLVDFIKCLTDDGR